MSAELNVEANSKKFNRTLLVDVNDVVVPKDFNTRITLTNVETLAASLEEDGQIQPIVCTRDADNRLVLISGSRRLRAARLLVEAGKEIKKQGQKIRTEIVDANSEEQLLMNIRENTEVAGLTLNDRLNQVSVLAATGKTQKEVAAIMGKSRVWVSDMLKIHKNIPAKARKFMEDGTIDYTTALEISKRPEDEREDAVDKAVKIRANKPGNRGSVRGEMKEERKEQENGRRPRKLKEIVSLFEDELRLDGTEEQPGMLAGIGEVLFKYSQGFYTESSVKSKLRAEINKLM